MTFHSTSNHLKINQLRDNTFSKRLYPFNLNIKNSSINKMPTNILNYFVIVPLNVSIFLSKFLQWRSQPYPILAQLRRSFLRFFSELWSILSKNIKLTVNIGHFEGQRETGSVLTCTEQHWDCFGDALFSLAITKLSWKLGQNSSRKAIP